MVIKTDVILHKRLKIISENRKEVTYWMLERDYNPPVFSHVPHHRLPVTKVLLHLTIKLVAEGPEQAVAIAFSWLYLEI